MSDVRTILERGVAGFDPSDGLDPTLRKARRRLRNRRILAGAVALIVTATGTGVAAIQFGRTQPPPPPASDVVLDPEPLVADVDSPVVEWEPVLSVPFGDGQGEVGTSPPAEGPPAVPEAFAMAPDGTFWIADPQNRRLLHLAGSGGYIGQVVAPDHETYWARGVAFVGEELYAFDEDDSELHRVRANGTTDVVPVRHEGLDLLVGQLFGTEAGLFAYAFVYREGEIEGLEGIFRIDTSSGVAERVDGVPLGRSEIVIQNGPPVGFAARTTHPGGSRERSFPVTFESRDRRPDSIGGIAEFVVGPGEAAAYFSGHVIEGGAGGVWVARLDEGLDLLSWEHIIGNEQGDAFSGETQHLGYGPDGSLYRMRIDQQGVHIVRRGVRPPDDGVDRDAGIYSALVRVFAHPDDYPIYILDHTSSTAASATGSGGETALIPPEVRERLVAELQAYDIRFVSSREEVLIPEGQGDRRFWGSVRDGGTLLTLGPIPDGESRVEIQANAFQAPKGAMWGTWVVELVDGAWKVTGEVGGISVS